MAQLCRQGKLAAINPTMRHLGQFLFYDDTRGQTARAAPKQNDSRPATRERGASAKQQIDAEMTSINRQLERLVESGNPLPREVDKAVAQLAQLCKRLEKLSTASRRNSTRRDDSTIKSAPTVRPTPTSDQSRRSNDDNNKNAIVQALHRLAQRQRNGDATVTTGGQWQNVPQYWAKKKERLRHRPAKATNAAVQAYRRRIIRDTNSSLPSTALPRRRRTVRFTDGPTEKQVFQISQLATSVSRGSGVIILPPVQQRVSILRPTKSKLTLLATEKKFITEDT